jgi:hypothetical protein
MWWLIVWRCDGSLVVDIWWLVWWWRRGGSFGCGDTAAQLLWRCGGSFECGLFSLRNVMAQLLVVAHLVVEMWWLIWLWKCDGSFSCGNVVAHLVVEM